jgi:hypothetical protein
MDRCDHSKVLGQNILWRCPVGPHPRHHFPLSAIVLLEDVALAIPIATGPSRYSKPIERQTSPSQFGRHDNQRPTYGASILVPSSSSSSWSSNVAARHRGKHFRTGCPRSDAPKCGLCCSVGKPNAPMSDDRCYRSRPAKYGVGLAGAACAPTESSRLRLSNKTAMAKFSGGILLATQPTISQDKTCNSCFADQPKRALGFKADKQFSQ